MRKLTECNIQVVFQEAMEKIHDYHISALKDELHPDALLESICWQQLGEKTMSINNLKAKLESESGAISEVRFQAILYAMRKQRLLKVDGDHASRWLK